MDRNVPRTASEEIELYVRTYYSLLRSSEDVQVKSLVETHAQMESLLHPHAREAAPDMSAFIYSVLRLPECIAQTRLVLLGQSREVFERNGFALDAWQSMPTRARRRRALFNGDDTLALFLASHSDIDDLVPLLTAYQIEWNKFHQRLRRAELPAEGEPLDRPALAELLGLTPDDLDRLYRIWGADLLPHLRAMQAGPKKFAIRLLASNYTDYRRASLAWYEHVERAAAPRIDLRQRAIYFVSSNTHSLINLLSGFALRHRATLLDYVHASGHADLQAEWRDIEARQVPSSAENFLYYVMKKYAQAPEGRALGAARMADEAASGLLRIPSDQDVFEVDTQLVELSRLRPEHLDPRLRLPGIEALADSQAVIFNIDYPLGMAAYLIVTQAASRVAEVRGLYVMGKAATLNGVVGDVMIPSVVYDEQSRNTFLFDNCFRAGDVAPHLTYGTALDNQKAVTVRGTFLQNANYAHVFYKENYTAIEMEAGPFLSAAFELARPKRYPLDEIVNLYEVPFDLGLLHYASDTPLSKGRNLGAANLSYFGMDPTYAASIAILRRIFTLEIEELTMSAIGHSHKRIDAVGKVTGATLYPGDINLPDQLHMKILFAGRPHARITRLDTARAEAVPGVVAVFTAKDVPHNEYGLAIPDQPVLCGPGSGKVGAEVVRYVGDQVALVVAETEVIAEQARSLIEVDYEDLPVVTDPRAAMQPDAARLFPDRENILIHYRIRHGDVDNAWDQCDAIVEDHYHTPMQEHAYLQPEAGLSYIDEAGRVTVQVAGQWAHEDQLQVAHSLGLPPEQIRIIYPAIGGAFGGREDMSVQIVLALAAWRLDQRGIHRPVKIIWSREESIIGHHKRHQFFVRSKWGAKADGALVAAEVELVSDAGAYAYTSTKVLGNATLMCTGPYVFPNANVDAYTVYTNNVPAGAFRGFGGPQGAFAAELQMDKLAAKLGLDPVAMRLKNVIREGDIFMVGTPFPPGVTLDRVVTRCAEEAGWQAGQGLLPVTQPEEPYLRRGRGLACAFKNIGFSFAAPESSDARVELHGKVEIERVVVYQAGADCGQGAHTVMLQMAAEAAGVPVERVTLVASDTATSGSSGSASASRLTYMSGNAIRGAVAAALQKWADEERPAIASYTYVPRSTTSFDPVDGHADPNFAYGYVAEAVEVEVDTETGHVRLVDVICADDVGKAINPQQVEGQIEGAVVQAAGYAVLENFIMKDGRVLTPFLSNYLIPTVLDVPERVKSVILEYAEPNGPFGVRGMAEMPYLPLAPAIAAAIHDATGVWVNEFPFTPDRVLRHLKNSASV